MNNKKITILVVEDNKTYGDNYIKILNESHFNAICEKSWLTEKTIANNKRIEFVLINTEQSHLIKKIKVLNANIGIFILTTPFKTKETSQLLEQGAYFYTFRYSNHDNSSFDVKKIKNSIDSFLSNKPHLIAMDPKCPDYITTDINFIDIRRKIESVSKSNGLVLIQGEIGSGKSLISRLLHANKEYKDGLPTNMVSVDINDDFDNISSIHNQKREVEKFIQHFESAHDGMLVLNNVDQLHGHLQEILLKTIKTNKFKNNQGIIQSVNFQVIITTKRNSLLTDINFNKELYDNIAISIFIDPIRWEERKNDIKYITCYLFEKYRNQFQRNVTGFSKEAVTVLENFAYPRNIIDLNELVRAATLRCQEEQITANQIKDLIRKLNHKIEYGKKYEKISKEVKNALEDMEVNPGYLLEEIQEASFNKRKIKMLEKIKHLIKNTILSTKKHNRVVKSYDINDIAKQIAGADSYELKKIKEEITQLKKGFFIK